MPEHNLSSIDGNAEVEINRIQPTPTLLRGGYQIRITVQDPEPRRTAITIDHDGFADLLTGILADDEQLRITVRQALFKRGMVMQDLGAQGRDPLASPEA